MALWPSRCAVPIWRVLLGDGRRGPVVTSAANRHGTQVTNEPRVPVDGRASYFETLSIVPQ